MTPQEALSAVRESFKSGKTLSKSFRIMQLQNLLRLFEENLPEMLNALTQDLKKCKYEAVLAEADFLKNDVKGLIYGLDSLMQPEKPEKTLVNMMDTVLIHKDPYGVVLIIAPWNYPLQLTFAPLAGAIAAGNCAIIKPSELASASAKLIAELIPKYLDTTCYKVILGGVPETTELLKLRYDLVFFTGSTQVGRIVQKAAAQHLTPVILELGGKSPVYVDSTVDLEITVRRILWGKLLNCGQSCIAPDYILLSKDLRDKFVEHAQNVINTFYGEKIKQSPDYARIINEGHLKRLVKLLDGCKIVHGGDYDVSDKFLEPTIVVDVKPTDNIMQEEIFGPILPIVTVESVSEAVDFINEREKPLALYVFSKNQTVIDTFIKNTSSGGVTVNDTMMHFNCDSLPFGGVGQSGIGAYHGKHSFDAFSHKKGVLIKDMKKLGETLSSARYPPYTEGKLKFVSTMTAKRRPLPFKFLMTLITFGLGALTTLSAIYAYNYWNQQRKA